MPKMGPLPQSRYRQTSRWQNVVIFPGKYVVGDLPFVVLMPTATEPCVLNLTIRDVVVLEYQAHDPQRLSLELVI
jgi:hypothetical protein